jgi:hypothetical protein
LRWHDFQRDVAVDGADGVDRVVVDAPQVRRVVDDRQVAVLDERFEQRRQLLGVPAEQHRVGEQPVLQHVVQRRDIGVGVGVRPCRGIAVDRHQPAVFAEYPRGMAAGQQQVVCDPGGAVQRQGQPWRVLAGHVSEREVLEHLVDRGPGADPVAEPLCDDLRVLGEPGDGVPALPAALVLRPLRQVPVEQVHRRTDSLVRQGVEQPVVEVQPAGVRLAGGVGDDPRPGHRQPVGVDPELRHQRHVLGEPVVVVARDVAFAVAEGVPHRWRAPVLAGGTFDLVRRRGHTPLEPRRKADHEVSVTWTTVQVKRRAPRARRRRGPP